MSYSKLNYLFRILLLFLTLHEYHLNIDYQSSYKKEHVEYNNMLLKCNFLYKE